MKRRSEDAPFGELEAFVRETLGCGCPDEIVARTDVERSADGELGLNVGGRLLVRVLQPDDRDRIIELFPETVERLCAERDLRGFNRLRLVAVCDEPEMLGPVLEGLLPAIAAADDRVHVHAVPRDGLPVGLRR